MEAPGQPSRVSKWWRVMGWWEQRTGQRLGGQQPRSAHPDRDRQEEAKINRSEEGRQDYLPLATSINHGTVDPHARPCILVGIETFCPLSSTAIITLVSKHFLAKPPAHNRNRCGFLLFPLPQHKPAQNTQLQTKRASHSSHLLKTAHLGVAFWNCKCMRSPS